MQLYVLWKLGQTCSLLAVIVFAEHLLRGLCSCLFAILTLSTYKVLKTRPLQLHFIALITVCLGLIRKSAD
jgi:hypothetical protein